MVFSIRFDGIRNELPVEHLSIERFDTVYHVKITNKHVSIGYTSEVNSVFNGVWEKQENACTAVAEVGVHKYYINGGKSYLKNYNILTKKSFQVDNVSETIILEEKQSGSLIFDVPKNAIVTILISSSKCSDLDVNREFANKFSYQGKLGFKNTFYFVFCLFEIWTIYFFYVISFEIKSNSLFGF